MTFEQWIYDEVNRISNNIGHLNFKQYSAVCRLAREAYTKGRKAERENNQAQQQGLQHADNRQGE